MTADGRGVKGTLSEARDTLAWQGKSYSPVTRSYDPYRNLTFDIRDLQNLLLSLFNSYKVTDKQSCNKINRIFTCRPDPEATAEAEGGFKEEEEAEEAQAERWPRREGSRKYLD